jgi:hypothetical protein
MNPKIDKMNGILNHMRIFSVNAFRYIPQLEWRDVYGVYLQDRIIILGILLELLPQHWQIRNPDFRHKFIYTKRKFADIFHFPTRSALLDSSVWIRTLSY